MEVVNNIIDNKMIITQEAEKKGIGDKECEESRKEEKCEKKEKERRDEKSRREK